MKRLLPISAVLLLLTLALFGCKDTPPPTEDEPTPEDTASAITFTIDQDIWVVRGEEAAADEKTAAAELRMGILEKTGVELKITTDWTNDKENLELTEYEILVGHTNREISVAEGLGLGDFIIRLVDGKKLVILGDSPQSTRQAVKYFLENYVDENGFTFGEIDMV